MKYVADARIVKIHGDEIDALKAENSSLSTTSSSHYYNKNKIDSLLADTESWKPWLRDTVSMAGDLLLYTMAYQDQN